MSHDDVWDVLRAAEGISWRAVAVALAVGDDLHGAPFVAPSMAGLTALTRLKAMSVKQGPGRAPGRPDDAPGAAARWADVTGSNGKDEVMTDRERLLWQAISRGLKLILNAIDQYVGKGESTAARR
jgi:hypothetical protein